MSTVSVIIPCYNYGRFLRQCLKSVLTQEGPEVEVLIIDDASSDGTREVATALAEADPRIEFRRHRINRGHIATYNEGLDWARGDYTVLLSADDLLADGALKRAAFLMDQHPDVGLVYGRVLRFTSEHPPTSNHPVSFSVVSGEEWMRRRCRAGDTCIASPEAMVRTELQHELGGYREELPHAGDMEMWMRFAVHAQLGDVDAVQAYVRRHEASMQHQRFASSLDRLQQRKDAFDAVFDRYGELISERDLMRALANRALARDALWSILQLVYRGEVNASRARALLRFAFETYVADVPFGDSWGASRARRAASWGMLVGPFLDGLTRWPRVWVNSRLAVRRGG